MFARKARAVRIAVVAVLLIMLIVPVSLTSIASAAAALPTGFVLRDQASGQAAYELTDFAYLPDGTYLTTGKKGKVAWVGPDGTSHTIAQLSVNSSGDLGLDGLAVAPDYATSRQIYLVRSVNTGGGFVIRTASWTVTGTAEPTGLAGEKVLVDVPGDGDPFHPGGGIVAAADGTVWVSVGDLGNARQPLAKSLRALDPNKLQGKILHLTQDGAGVSTNPYFEPSNPGSVRSRVYASGFRSPFRLSLDPKTGQPVVGDVGWNTWEEVDVVQPGGNYAWPCYEANHPSPGYIDMPECAGVRNTPPIWEYSHGTASNQGNCVIGGIVYTGSSYPAQYRGKYFFGDYVGKKLWTMGYDTQGKLTQAPQNPPFATDIGGPVKFAAAPNGDIVFADILSGKVRRLSYKAGNSPPVASATTTTDPATRTVTFDGSGSSDPDADTLTYRWVFGDGTPNGTGVKTTHTYTAAGDMFTATLTVTDPLGLTNTTPPITVAPSNHSPVLVLKDPGNHRFAVGEAVRLSATATDADEAGALPITWTSLVRHCPTATTCHAHPGAGATGTTTFSFPFTDHPDSRMEFVATATDKVGVSTSKTYVAKPKKHRLTLVSTVPATLQIPEEGG